LLAASARANSGGSGVARAALAGTLGIFACLSGFASTGLLTTIASASAAQHARATLLMTRPDGGE